MGRGLPCLDMHVRTRLSPSLRDIEGNPDIVGASGGPGNMKVSKLQIEKFSPNIIYLSIQPLIDTILKVGRVFRTRCISLYFH